jgi:hypothetical protein
MSANTRDTITQAELRIGTALMENVSMATRACKAYMQELQLRLASGETIEQGQLTFKAERMLVSYTVC